jgi:Raf kinase inhibitor-like YbhB/YbcL family protein
MSLILVGVAGLSNGLLNSCAAADEVAVKGDGANYKWELTSKSFKDGQKIPALHTADGKDLSPELSWSEPPKHSKSQALICDDPDAPAGTWVHWVIYNIPASERQLLAAVPVEKTLNNGTMQGTNSFDNLGYNGPSPPAGKLHHYLFKLYALDAPVALKPGAKKDDLLKAMKDHVLAETKLVGVYER